MLLTSPPASRRGAAKPRVETAPQVEYSFGPEALELAGKAGLVLDPWQADAANLMFGVRGDGQWSCFEYAEIVPRQNGKGAILEARALAGLFLLPEQLIMWSAHEYKTAMEAFLRILALLGRLGTRINDTRFDVDGIPIKVNNTNGEEGIERLDTGQRVKFIARSKGSGRGFSGDVNIIDEAYAYTRMQQAALMPTMSARPNPQIIYTSTPPLDGLSGEVLYQLRKRGDAAVPRRPHDPPWMQDDALGWRDWGLGGDLDHLNQVNLDDRRLWVVTNPADRVTLEFISRERRSMGALEFARERLGIWPRQLGEGVLWQILTEQAWADAEQAGVAADGSPAIAVDVTPDRSTAAIGAAASRVGGGRMVDVFEHRPGGGVRWVLPVLRELDERYQPLVTVINDKALADEAEDAGLKVHRASAGDVAAGAAAMFDGIAGADEQGRDVKHPGRPELTAAAAGATTRTISGTRSWAWDRSDAAVDISPLVASSIALWALGTPRIHVQRTAFFGAWR